ncbi:MAG TPA: tetratricopeptide repeat protein [Desulfobacterales bacterium]|nr:tetratricopeptide repeat protein [Desulfobacterales bacterium]
MTRYIRPLSYLLLLLLLQACASTTYHRPQKARPYPPPQTQQSGREGTSAPTIPTVPTIPTAAPTKNSTVQNIQNQATQLRNQGQLEAAAQTLERGLRIAPKDASLWSQLAMVRLQQRQYGQAQSMAHKSNNLARGNSSLIQRNQNIILEAQMQQR